MFTMMEGCRGKRKQLDGVWAWVVATGAFTTLLLMDGTFKSLGVLLTDIREEFSTATWVIGLIITLGHVLGAILCRTAGIITRRLSPRYTMMVFGLLAALGLVFGSMARHLYFFAMSICLSGFSIGTAAICIAALSSYFNIYYDTAVAFAMSGVGIGVMIMPLLTQFLRNTYGWRGAMLIVGGLNLNIVVCGATLRYSLGNGDVNTSWRLSMRDTIRASTRNMSADTTERCPMRDSAAPLLASEGRVSTAMQERIPKRNYGASGGAISSGKHKRLPNGHCGTTLLAPEDSISAETVECLPNGNYGDDLRVNECYISADTAECLPKGCYGAALLTLESNISTDIHECLPKGHNDSTLPATEGNISANTPARFPMGHNETALLTSQSNISPDTNKRLPKKKYGAIVQSTDANVTANTQQAHLPNDYEQESKSTRSTLNELGFTLNVEFLSLIIIALGAGYVMQGWTLYIVPEARNIGFKYYHSALLATLGGIGHIVGCVIFPLLTKILSSKGILYVATVTNSVALLLDPISSAYRSYIGLMVSCATFGVGRAIIFVILFKCVKEQTISDERKTICITWIFFAGTCGSLLSGFLTGWLFDRTASYTTSFIVLSIVPLLTVIPRLVWDISQCMHNETLNSPDPNDR